MRALAMLFLGLFVSGAAMAIVSLPGTVRGGLCWDSDGKDKRNPISRVCLHEVTGQKGSKYISYTKADKTMYAKAQGNVTFKRVRGSVEVDKNIYTGYALEDGPGFPLEVLVQLSGELNDDETELSGAALLVNGTPAIGGLTLTPPIEIESVQPVK